MIYQIKDGRVMFAADTVLSDFDFEVRNKNEKIAVIGRNGAGKTTLLKVIAGDVELTRTDGREPSITAPGNPVIGYLRQITFDDLSLTLDEEIRKVFKLILDEKARIDELVGLMEGAAGEAAEKLAAEYTALMDDFRDRGGYYYEKEYDAMLVSFGFSLYDKKKPLSEFSGGQLTKLAFIKLLLSKPDILLLDEPTNHLDMSTVAWLEDYLKNYSRAVVIVSHDRMFLDRIVNVVYEITYGTVTRFSGNYSDYVVQKKERYEKQLKDHIAQQKEIKRLTELVERFKNKPSKVAMTRSKLKMIEHMELVARPADYDTKSFKASFTPKMETGKDVLTAKDLSVGYDSPLATVNLDIKRGERLAVLGDNGIGKSTLLKTLVGEIEPLSGDFRFGVNADIGYFDQRMAMYTSDSTVIDDYWNEFPTLTETQVRTQLGTFLFTQDEVFKEVSALSGGERVRLCLAKIFNRRPNVLILDEPTNHMDMIGKETLEAMLASFPGTVIFVSHDRYFVKKVATQILDMRTDGVTLYPFGYDDYVEKCSGPGTSSSGGSGTGKDQQASKGSGGSKGAGSLKGSGADADLHNTSESSAPVSASQAERLAGKEAEKKRRRIKKLEERIEQIEEKAEKLREELCKPEYASDYDKLAKIQEEIDAAEAELLETMEQWEAESAEMDA
ncbi:MAG: ABC-F family ATP-binding cassette domain-containing protein [Lachnospiraceae bacterium]|nr:ABC-F family ATP-binding cassette domain-containing protein [Lachnospiraceae bacterium]